MPILRQGFGGIRVAVATGYFSSQGVPDAFAAVEVAYEHMQGSRFRHMAQFRRWRADKQPVVCTYAQLEVVPPQELMEIFAGGR